jgi:hypothetical protein
MAGAHEGGAQGVAEGRTAKDGLRTAKHRPLVRRPRSGTRAVRPPPLLRISDAGSEAGATA